MYTTHACFVGYSSTLGTAVRVLNTGLYRKYSVVSYVEDRVRESMSTIQSRHRRFTITSFDVESKPNTQTAEGSVYVHVFGDRTIATGLSWGAP